jgi:YHS domain-containing protein
MRNSILKALSIWGIAVLLTSCTMMGPVHIPGGHNITLSHTHSQGYFDPVCGTPIETVQDELTWQYEGTTYYFHSSDCMEEFKRAPEKYIHYSQNNRHDATNRNVFLWVLGSLTMGVMMIAMLL